jgi:sugar diacid utilization regulator
MTSQLKIAVCVLYQLASTIYRQGFIINWLHSSSMIPSLAQYCQLIQQDFKTIIIEANSNQLKLQSQIKQIWSKLHDFNDDNIL